jgi:dTDP-4-dehydrorhamnose 3,5-epimerase
MQCKNTPLADVKILEPRVFGDDRGFFMETFRLSFFNANCSNKEFVQDNHSKSTKGILRGLHYQTSNVQGKLVRVISGKIFDVIVDMRKYSPTFGKWFGIVLSDENKKQLWVPEGFAHGFYVISETAEFVYKCTNYYNPKSEISILWNDPSVKIDWPLNNNEPPFLSSKDENGISFKDAPKFESPEQLY